MRKPLFLTLIFCITCICTMLNFDLASTASSVNRSARGLGVYGVILSDPGVPDFEPIVGVGIYDSQSLSEDLIEDVDKVSVYIVTDSNTSVYDASDVLVFDKCYLKVCPADYHLLDIVVPTLQLPSGQGLPASGQGVPIEFDLQVIVRFNDGGMSSGTIRNLQYDPERPPKDGQVDAPGGWR